MFGHEMAHHWANNNFKWMRDGNPSESFKAMWGAVESWLGVRPEQTKLSSAQSEKVRPRIRRLADQVER